MAGGPDAAPSEVLFLIVQALSQAAPFAALAEQLAAEAAAQGLLPCRHDISGAQHTLTLDELRQRYAHLPPDALHQLLSQLLERRRQDSPQPAARGLTSLLEGGTLGVLRGGAPPPPPPPAWLRLGAVLPSVPQRLLLLREAGLACSAQHPATVAPPADYARHLAHHVTLRGHRFAVYCLSYDRTGRYLITGSDDRLVKIWSTRTGLLQACCRGHDAEVADLAVSADNSLVASSSMDGTVRVWELQSETARPGDPVSVLAGHAGPAVFLDFHPTLPDALLSASFDGTCRIWRARDAAAPPIVLRVDAARFGLSGHATTRLGGLAWQPVAGAGTSASAAAAAAPAHLFSDGVRTTRNMERQLLGLAQAAGPHSQQQQQQQGGARGGRGARQQRGVSEAEDDWEEGAGDSPRAATAAALSDDEEGGEARAGATGFQVCGFSQDGTHIVAAGNDCNVYVWQWTAADTQQSQQQKSGERGSTPPVAAATSPLAQSTRSPSAPARSPSTRAAAAAAPADGSRAERPQAGAQPPAGQAQRPGRSGSAAAWPAPKELCQLSGHRNDVVLLEFSHAGDRVATGSKDGSVRVWRRPRRWRKRPQAWEQELTFAVLPDPEAVKEARRRRRPPPAPAIDQAAWSADDQLLVVCVSDFGMRVLAVPGGEVLHNLSIHTSHVHTLACHPTQPHLAFSASYDGTLALWDMLSGAVLRKFSTRHTRPDGRAWPDSIPIADGHFSPDGNTITVSDVAGQLHHYGLGPREGTLLLRAPYDQFQTNDFAALIRDLQHNVVDAATQLPPHLPEARGALCDALGNPYPEPLQAAFRQQRVLAVPPQEAAWLVPGTTPGYLLGAPTFTAAEWAVEQANGTEHMQQTALVRAQERLAVYDARLDAGMREAAAREAADEAARPRPRARRDRGAWAEEAPGGEGEGEGEAGEHSQSSGEVYAEGSGDELADSDEDVDSGMLTSEEEDDDSEESEGGGGGVRRAARAAAEASRHSSRLAGRRARGGAAARAGAARRALRAAAEGGDETPPEQPLRGARQRQDREARAARRRAAEQQQLADERHRRQRAAAARRRAAADSSDGDDSEAAAAAGSSRRPAAARSHRRRHEADSEAEEEHGEEPAPKRARRAHGSGGRQLSSYSWLLAAERTSAVYVPQAGDEVVYLREGHGAYLAGTNDKRPPPWATLRHGRAIRPAEPCRVVDVQYAIADDGSDRTLAQLTLSFVDGASPLKDTCISVEVPSPAAGYADFVILRSRFEASVVAKCWGVGEQCQVYWNDEEASGNGEWWLGTVIDDARGGRRAWRRRE